MNHPKQVAAVLGLLNSCVSDMSVRRRALIMLSAYAWRVGNLEDADAFDREYDKAKDKGKDICEKGEDSAPEESN